MKKTEKNGAAVLTLVKGGSPGANAFAALPLAEKEHYLKGLRPKERMDLMLGDPEGRLLVRSMGEQEFFWLFKDIGETDALELLQLASPEQCLFMLDMELWSRWSFSSDKAVEWIGYLLEGGDDRIVELLPRLDFELLQLLFSRELLVGGGIGDLSNDEERLADWDHSFDDTFMITFRNPKHSQVIGRFVESICRLDNALYVALMEGVKNDIETELEEACSRFRDGRLADLGFPSLDEALSLYSRLKPAGFALEDGKEHLTTGPAATLPVPVGEETSLLLKALALAGSDDVQTELNYLINSALVADETAFSDSEAMHQVVQRVYGYLNIALEHLCGGDAEKAGVVLSGEYLKRLFQLGYSILLEVKGRAEKLESDNYATNKLLMGLKNKRPRFYRGLDADNVDGYREFRSMADVARVGGVLRHLEG